MLVALDMVWFGLILLEVREGPGPKPDGSPVCDEIGVWLLSDRGRALYEGVFALTFLRVLSLFGIFCSSSSGPARASG